MSNGLPLSITWTPPSYAVLGVPARLYWAGSVSDKSSFQTKYASWATNTLIYGKYTKGGDAYFIGMKTSDQYGAFLGLTYNTSTTNCLFTFVSIYSGTFHWSDLIS